MMRAAVSSATGVALLLSLAAGAGAKPEVPRLLWQTVLPDSPVGGVAAAGGLAFVALLDGTVRAYALETGKEKWKRSLGVPPQTGAAVGGGVVLVAGTDRKLRAWTAGDGTPRWQADLAAQASTEIAVGDTLAVVGEGNKTCSAWNLANGASLWRCATLGELVAAPWIGAERVVFGTTAHTVYAVAKLTGAVERQAILSGEAYGRPGGEPGGGARALLALGTHDGRLHALTTEGDRLWAAKLRGIPRAAPLLRPEALYAGTDQGLVYAIGRDGRIRWDTGVGGPVVDRIAAVPHRIAVGAGGVIAFLDPDTGRVLEQIVPGGIVTGMAEEDGTVVAATSARTLVGAGVRVRAAGEEAKAPPGLVSVVVEPTTFAPRNGGRVSITFSLREARPLVVDVADARGRRVKLLTSRDRAWPDTYRFEWDGVTEAQKIAPPGVYRLRVVAGEEDMAMGIEVVGGR